MSPHPLLLGVQPHPEFDPQIPPPRSKRILGGAAMGERRAGGWGNQHWFQLISCTWFSVLRIWCILFLSVFLNHW